MPEGPSIIILKKALAPYKRKKVLNAKGYADIPFRSVKGKILKDIKTWGKHTLLCFSGFTIKVHLMLLGSYTIDKPKKYNPKLSLQFTNGSVYLYLAQITILEEPLNKIYDWTADIMSNKWDPGKAKKKMLLHPSSLLCDLLLDQAIFAGSGNIIKNEALFMARLHPKNKVEECSAAEITKLVNATRKFAFNFLQWKEQGVLDEHLKVYEQKECPRCNKPLVKKVLGKTKRKCYYCENCQL